MLKRMILFTLVSVVITSASLVGAQGKRVVNIYSSRHYGALEAPFVKFQEETGIEIRLSQGSPRDLLERLRAEGDRTPADIFLAIDAGVLSLAAEEGLLQPIDSDILNANIPASQRDPEGHWFGLSQRVRTLVYNIENVSSEELDTLNTYADLASSTWEGRTCFRPASHIYTISMFSSLVYHLGEDETRTVVEGIVANKPKYIDSDSRQIEAVSAGECDIALVNHYYYANFIAQENPVTQNTALKWLNQDTTGAFYNINGAGVTANAEHYEEAVAFIEYFSTPEGQAGSPQGFPGSNNEFPTNPTAEPSPILLGLGELKLDTDYPLWEYGAYQELTINLLEAAGFGFQES